MELRASPPTRRPHHGAAPSLEALATRNRVYHRIVSSICRTAIDHWHTPLGAEREGPRYRCDGSVVGQLEAMLCQQATEDDFHLVNREGGPHAPARAAAKWQILEGRIRMFEKAFRPKAQR